MKQNPEKGKTSEIPTFALLGQIERKTANWRHFSNFGFDLFNWQGFCIIFIKFYNKKNSDDLIINKYFVLEKIGGYDI
jgi:hypothetical protein